MALGAQPAQVVGLVMRSGLQLVAIGLVLGLAGAAGAARLIQTLLFHVRPLDPIVYAVVAVVFTIVATLACLRAVVAGLADRSADRAARRVIAASPCVASGPTLRGFRLQPEG